MIDRCTLPTHPRYYRYGGRGVQIDPAWTGPGGFARFLGDMGERPDGLTLDRVDGNGHYTPGNCRWATPLEQTWNRRCMTVRDEELPPEEHIEPLTPVEIAPAQPAAAGSDWQF
jgi:hypothetical protein